MILLTMFALTIVSHSIPLRLEYCNVATSACKDRGWVTLSSEGVNFTSSDIYSFETGSWLTSRLHTAKGVLVSSTPVQAPGLSTGEELALFIGKNGAILSASIRQTKSHRFEVTSHTDAILPSPVIPEKVKLEEPQEEPSLIRKYWWAFVIAGILLSAMISDNK